jgi:conjugative relaxase-like TrwC/TraI family protein
VGPRSDRDVAAQVVAAHDAAVAAAVGYLEREAGYSRRGAGGTETVQVDGFVAAAFRHRTSRANDPLLHTHVLIANVARTTDDRVWRTLDSRRLYAHAKTAGVLYQAQLRWELTRRLGVAWQPVINGVADLAGVDRVSAQFRKLCETAGVRRVRLHDTRHAMATLMLAAGIRVEVVSKRLGHARISVTYDMYTHPDDEQQREAADAFGRLLADGGET